MHDHEWERFIDEFHDRHAGITETVLGTANRDDVTPYEWLVASLPDSATTVLDLACGSGPLQPLVPSAWIGVDLAVRELELAQARTGRTPIVRGDLTALPVRTAAVDVVTCAMALMVVTAVGPTLDELRRVLGVGGVAAFLLPALQPLTIRDRLRYARLLGALRHRSIPFPQPEVVRSPGHLLRSAGFSVESDEQRTFRYPIIDEASSRCFVDSLYLPATPRARVEVARLVVNRWVGTDIGVPLRRILVTRR